MYMYYLTNFYRFLPLSLTKIDEWRESLTNFSSNSGLSGLIVLALDGINTTVSSESPHVISEFKLIIQRLSGLNDIFFKDSQSSRRPFKRFKVDLRKEIVTLKKDKEFGLPPANPEGKLSPQEWHEVLTKQPKDSFCVIDVRNDYEIKLGKFEGAISPQTEHFSQFPEFLDKFEHPKDKKLLIYCTSGIRCERAYEEFAKRGYSSVHQLHGGIVKYLEEFPNQTFKGECFIFDHRVALQQDLRESENYKLCPHCGNPGDEKICCEYCNEFAVVCVSCLEKLGARACSKNCRYHLTHRRGSSRLEARAS